MKLTILTLQKAMFIAVCACSVLFACKGYDKEYDCAAIPAYLLKDAKSVLRKDINRFEVVSRKKAIETVKHAVTILCKDDQHLGELVLDYDNFKKIDDLEGTIYNAKGEKVRELESSEIQDFSASGSFSLYSDLRVKVSELYYDKYPYTVEYKYKIIYKGNINWPGWISQPILEPVEYTSFEVLIDKEQELRYWCNSDTVKPAITIADGQKKYLWEAFNLRKLSKDIVGEDEEDYAAVVKIAPTEIEMEGFSGKMSTWKEFGNWMFQLYKDKDKLPEEAKKDIGLLIKTGDDTLTKIQKLYSYMQNRTRYVSIQLGIGGWMPFDASYVHEKGYGDCKALANYMHSLLNEVGIASYPALIYSGIRSRPITTELPGNQFNHAILCVPVKNDTLWLECTNQFIPMGLIHSGIIDRLALLITKEGGRLVRTPPTCPKDNRQIRNSTVNFIYDGNATATSAVYFSGIPQNDFIQMYHNSSPQEREKWIQNEIDIPNLNLNEYAFTGIDSIGKDAGLSIKLNLRQYASVSGTRLFFLPNLMERRKYIPPDIPKRLSPIRFSYPYLDVDTVTFILPENVSIESMPAEVKLESSFGRFNSKSVFTGSKIVFTRSLEIFNCTVPASNYTEYRNFISAIVKADKAQVVLVKKK